MDFKTDEIVSLLKEQLQNHNADIDVSEVGEITYVGDGVARVSGLENVMSSELVELPNDIFGAPYVYIVYDWSCCYFLILLNILGYFSKL